VQVGGVFREGAENGARGGRGPDPSLEWAKTVYYSLLQFI
jgi:hypothetical protein